MTMLQRTYILDGSFQGVDERNILVLCIISNYLWLEEKEC